MIVECAGYNEMREQAMQEIKGVWGPKGTERWEQMEQGEQVAELLGIPKGTLKEYWIIVKRMMCNMWQIRSER